jgi:hypothetical protein
VSSCRDASSDFEAGTYPSRLTDLSVIVSSSSSSSSGSNGRGCKIYTAYVLVLRIPINCVTEKLLNNDITTILTIHPQLL